MEAVTIDQLDIKNHVRWAQDQKNYDDFFVKESHVVAPHPEILGTSAIYASKFEELFELQKKNPSWAFFAHPKNFHLFSRRFFSYRLFPSIYWEETEESDEDAEHSPEDEQHEESDSNNLIQQVINVKKNPQDTQSLFEKDKTAILSLLEAIKQIDKMLGQVNARKLQYQKG